MALLRQSLMASQRVLAPTDTRHPTEYCALSVAETVDRGRGQRAAVWE